MFIFILFVASAFVSFGVVALHKFKADAKLTEDAHWKRERGTKQQQQHHWRIIESHSKYNEIKRKTDGMKFKKQREKMC